MKRHRKNLSEDRLIITRSKNSEGRREINSEETVVPVDLIFEVLSRLPAKSIARCRCVSKIWKSRVLRPCFTELFLTRSWARPHVLLACLNDNKELLFFSTPQLQNPDVDSSPVVAANSHMKFSFDCSYEICGLVHGLICVITKPSVKKRKETVPVICNPSTGESLTLPKVKTRSVVGVRCMFGYDPIDKQFKLLSMISDGVGGDNKVLYHDHQVLTLGTGNLSWRKIECRISHAPPLYYPDQEMYINGVLYYLVRNRSKETMIACFDVRSEKFRFIKFKKASTIEQRRGKLTNYNGKLGLLFSEGSRTLKFWVLEDSEKLEWSKHIYTLPALWENVVDPPHLLFLGVTRTNEIVLRTADRYSSFCVFYYNIERSTITRTEIQGVKANDKFYAFLDHVEDVTPMQVFN